MANYSWNGAKILIADDEKMNFILLKVALRNTQSELFWAETGTEAIRICKENHIQLVLMDIQMPEMDGLEATKILKEIRPNLPIIAQTAFTHANDQRRCLQIGCDAFITKPLDLDATLQLINELLIAH